VATSNDLVLSLSYQSRLDPNTLDDFSQFLGKIIRDSNEDPNVIRIAIKGIQYLNLQEHIADMQLLLSNKSIVNNQPLARSLCITLAHFRQYDAIPSIKYIVETTNDEYIFASAALALGILGNEESLKILVENENRFNGVYCGVAIRKMDNVIIEILNGNNPELQYYAVKAIKYFYDGFIPNPKLVSYQLLDFQFFKPYLLSILQRTEDNELIKFILIYLATQNLSKIEAKNIVEGLHVNNIYKKEWLFIKNLIESEKAEIRISEKQLPVPKSQNLLFNNQEYGDALYRELNLIPGLEGLGHAGLFAGIDNEGEPRTIEVKFGTSYVIHENYFSEFKDDDYWGAGTVTNIDMDFSKRKSVVSTAVELISYDIAYPWINPYPNALDYYSDAGSIIYPQNIKRLRCDGLVEYCYEYNNIWVWGANQTNYDISNKNYVAEHNDFYDAWDDWDPNTELAPVVQCGYAGGLSTNLSLNRTSDLPNISAEYAQIGNKVVVTVTATDRSGIYRIAYWLPGISDWAISPIQPQHPTSSSYTYQFELELTHSDTIWFCAMDNGGNQHSNNYPYIYIDLKPDIELSITSPTSGESWNHGSTASVKWYYQNYDGNIDIEIYKGGEAPSHLQATLASNIAVSNRQKDINIPNWLSTGNDYKIRIKASTNDDTYDFSDYFSIRKLAITYPNGGESFEQSEMVSVLWNPDNVSGDAQIDLYKNGSNITTLVDDISVSQGNRLVTIPLWINPDDDYQIHLSAYDGQIYDLSDSYFTIRPNVSVPDNVIASDGEYTNKIRVTWDSATNASYYRVFRSTDSSGDNAIALANWQTSTSYTDESPTPGQTYYYCIKAATSSVGANATDCSAHNSGWRKLAAPSALTASDGLFTDRVEVTWNETLGANCYRVFRAASNNVENAVGISQWQTNTNYDDHTVTAGQTYYYWAKAAINSSGDRASDYSAVDFG
ncbi:hypothetical protein JW960_13160, partial [candidate division KSB1 bacterium]|nr:hypothetical protein [candidate division KSB1 bacterium]